MGTKTAGSCLDSNALERVESVLTNISDPKVRIIAVKDPFNGNILARTFFKLLWDEQNQVPVLFLIQIFQ